MRKNSHFILAIAAFGLLATEAFAGTVPSVGTVGDLASIQSDTLLGKAQLAKEQVFADLRKFNGDGQPGGASAQIDSSLPQLTRIVEANGVSEATLAYANGKIDAREGDRVPGGYVLTKIHPDTSVIQLKARNGRVFEVPVSSLTGLSVTPTTPQPATSNGLIVLPPPPTTAGSPQPQQLPANAPHLTPSIAGSSTSSMH
ncbi:type IV pilus biogenesis protein PilP (plasmid) [Paraburkholderia sprentiae WSM5005]|uniref:Type IV pilus biogenesis protein PilP n=1 Tax=Paraburkholderia sprentiae WSM5005 TaxID=754502 RepID=A0ACA8AX75_9BURK|nr:type IV pilus biogenesis protein PilP [Paraburkholderia sprentiae]APA90234.1 type IV pilus biogenesis protein PilP [Paraburkholderia sprentiae WSM5005]